MLNQALGSRVGRREELRARTEGSALIRGPVEQSLRVPQRRWSWRTEMADASV